jgi:hypothetical protein
MMPGANARAATDPKAGANARAATDPKAGANARAATDPKAGAGPLGALARLRQTKRPTDPGERCEMCASEIPAEHAHLVDLDDRSLLCTCQACRLLFTNPGAGAGRYRAVPDRYLQVVDFSLTDSQWDALQIPVAVAFFFKNSGAGAIAAFFPGPAGATECLLPLDAWADIEAGNPVVASLEPDTEALLVRAPGGEKAECFLVPIDSCYELVGHLRRLWRGFDGGAEAHEAMDAYFARLRQRARPVTLEGHGG